MDLTTFKNTLGQDSPPSDIHPLLVAMWYDAQDDWEKAHNIAQDISSNYGSLVHAYLHRKEGDIWNADYWYRRAERSRPDTSLEKEWDTIVNELLSYG